MNKGILYAIAAYGIWGLFPLYWKTLQHVPALEILSHRMTWSLGFVLLRWAWLKTAVHTPRIMLLFFASATLLSVNWFVYIWGVNAGSFALYGLIRKTAPLGSLEGLSLETALMFLPALVIYSGENILFSRRHPRLHPVGD